MKENNKRAISGIIYIAIMWLGTCYSKNTFSLLFAILGCLTIYEILKIRKNKSKIIPLLYAIIPFLLIQIMTTTDNNFESKQSLILFIFLLTWTFDTFAYLFGVKFGKHKIMPFISPKKSWEGFFAGAIFTIIVSYLATSSLVLFNSINNALIITISLPFTATIGDFIASYYKREAGMKDSGKLIPGHGGILDRMDAFMITIPAIYLFINFL